MEVAGARLGRTPDSKKRELENAAMIASPQNAQASWLKLGSEAAGI
jgi:hypothetical protein